MKILRAMQKFFNRGVPEGLEHLEEHWNVLNIATFGTEAARAAVATACRGYRTEEYPEGIDSDVAQYLSGMIPSERGVTWTLAECFYGDADKDRKPIAPFIKEVAKYPDLKEIMLSIEGLRNKRSSHASGVYLYNDGYLKHNALMKTPSGIAITQFDMDDSDYMGSLKYDFLTVEALDKIRTAIDLLVEDGQMEWEGSLKATYDKHLHPDILEYDNQEIWQLMGNGEIVDLFQFQTDVGSACIKKIKPTNLAETATSNSLMRLMAEHGHEQPMDRYIRFRNDETEWDVQMMGYGLTQSEQEIMKKYLGYTYGVAATQEDLMEMSMEPKITNFTLTEANKLRKGIARKNQKVIDEVKDMFYQKGEGVGSRKLFLDYVWNEQVVPQLGWLETRMPK